MKFSASTILIYLPQVAETDTPQTQDASGEFVS